MVIHKIYRASRLDQVLDDGLRDYAVYVYYGLYSEYSK